MNMMEYHEMSEVFPAGCNIVANRIAVSGKNNGQVVYCFPTNFQNNIFDNIALDIILFSFS